MGGAAHLATFGNVDRPRPSGPPARVCRIRLTSRGYREEQEHLAWLIRNPGKGKPRCGPEVGLADAVVTLVSNMAARGRQRIEFRDEWFDVNSDTAPA